MNTQGPSQNVGQPNAGQIYTILGGLALIIVGVIWLMQNLTGLTFGNWWAIFILIPAVASFSMAWQTYRTNGRRYTSQVNGMLWAGVTTLIVAIIFLLDLDWGRIWPVFLILAGLSSLARSMWRVR